MFHGLRTALFIICSLFSGYLYADGEHLWSAVTKGEVWSSIQLRDDVAFFGSDDGRFYALELNSQEYIWRFQTQGKVRSTAAFHKELVLFSSDDGHLYALNSKTGKVAWKFDLGDGAIPRHLPSKTPPHAYDYRKASPIVKDGVVYVGSATSSFYALEANSGTLIWKVETNGIIRTTAEIDNENLYIGTLSNTVYALNREDGRVNWRFDAYNKIVSKPSLIDGLLIVGSRDTYIYALQPESGEEIWSYKFSDGSWVDSTAVSADQGKAFFIGSSDSKKLLKFSTQSGKLLWSAATSGWTWGTPLLHDGIVYIGSTGAHEYWNNVEPGFFAIDGKSGDVLWQYHPKMLTQYIKGGVFGTPAIYNKQILIPDLDGHVHAYRISQ
ncbi:PQQ-binding-like beta-propeller repeat protein [Vibrio rotiferianus]|uniref:PQQ-binding-like beta-propeller repeat protein n=1 Tax=Vibrio rotiferianus TaxID=190895 RepID=UPI0009F6723A|nr:PQQ-binding-like beta-propeller repeat protein [Vibrio rotiferianus]